MITCFIVNLCYLLVPQHMFQPVCGSSVVLPAVMFHRISLSSVLTELLFMSDLWEGKEFYPLTPEILTSDLSGLPPVFIGTTLFMFGRICVVPQIEGCRAACVVVVVVEKSWFAYWPETSMCVYMCMCVCVWLWGQGKKAERSIVVSALFWPEGRKPWKWGAKRRRKKCHSNTVSVKGIWD